MNNQVLNSQQNHVILSGVIQVPVEEIKKRHDILMAELQQLREWLGYRPIPTRAHQTELRESANR